MPLDDVRAQIDSLVHAKVAYRQAGDRVKTAERAGVREALYAPLTEACWWVISIDEGHEELDKTARLSYKARRNSDHRGEVLLGLRYVRNVLGHKRFFDVTEMKGGLTFPMTFPMRIPPVVARWRPIEDIAAPDRNEPSLAAGYVRHVQGRPVLECLEQAFSWFESWHWTT